MRGVRGGERGVKCTDLGMASSEFDVDIEPQQVSHQHLLAHLMELEQILHLGDPGVADVGRGDPVVQDVHHLGPQVGVVYMQRLSHEESKEGHESVQILVLQDLETKGKRKSARGVRDISHKSIRGRTTKLVNLPGAVSRQFLP